MLGAVDSQQKASLLPHELVKHDPEACQDQRQERDDSTEQQLRGHVALRRVCCRDAGSRKGEDDRRRGLIPGSLERVRLLHYHWGRSDLCLSYDIRIRRTRTGTQSY